MCMLTYFPGHVTPDLQALSNGAAYNDDGHGFAIVTGETEMIIEHGLDAAQLIGRFGELRDKHRSGPALFHSRFATHGKVDLDNCHPFAVAGDQRTVVAHNGVLPDKVRPRKGDSRSDTRIAAEDFLPRKPYRCLDQRKAHTALQQWLGTTNKLVFLTVHPRYRQHAYLINGYLGVWDDETGIWYSNHDYQLDPARLGADAEFPDVCPVCYSAGGLDDYASWCRICQTCLDCGDGLEHCRCYVPDPGYGAWRSLADALEETSDSFVDASDAVFALHGDPEENPRS